MPPATVVFLLTLLLGIQPVTTDLYLPALPALTRAFDAPVSTAQLTLSALIVCFGFAQLVCGPLADRHGRRPVLLWGLGLYTLASMLAVLAPSIEWLIAWRALQGVAMAASVTCGRSLIRDLYEPLEGARVFARAAAGLGVIAMIGPLLGGAIATWVHFRAALASLAVFGAVTLAFVAWRYVETVPARDPQATRLVPLLRNWRQIVAHPGFRAYAALSAATYGGLFSIIVASSFVFIEVLGASRFAYGGYFALASACYIGGTLCCRRLLVRGGLRGAIAVGGFISLAGGVSMLGLALAGVASVWAVALPQCIYAFAHGIHQPCAQVGAIAAFPDKAGSAAALSGFAMMLVAFVVGVVLGHSLNGTVLPMAIGVAGFAVAVAVVAWTLVQWHGAPGVAPIAQAA